MIQAWVKSTLAAGFAIEIPLIVDVPPVISLPLGWKGKKIVSGRMAERKNLPRDWLQCHKADTFPSPEEGVQPAQLLLQGCSMGSKVNVSFI